MRRSHFWLAALVALATSFGLRAAAYRHHWRAAQAGYFGPRAPWRHHGPAGWRPFGPWGRPTHAPAEPLAPAP